MANRPYSGHSFACREMPRRRSRHRTAARCPRLRSHLSVGRLRCVNCYRTHSVNRIHHEDHMEQHRQKAPSPELIFSYLNAFQQSAALKGAVDLEMFTAIAEGNATVADIAKRCNASERGTRILADYLTVLGLLTKKDNKYSLTADAAIFLDKHKPSYLGDAIRFLMAPDLRKGFDDIAGAVRK